MMSCPKFETDIALYAGGDLPSARIAQIESHLACCVDCRALLEDLRAGQALLSELRDDPLEEALLANVHGEVMAEVWSAGSNRRRALVPLLALAAALLLAAILIWPRHAAKQVPIAHVAAPQNTPAPRVEPVKMTPVRQSRVHHRRPRRPHSAEPAAPLLVQFATDNPNIVIYWLVDQKQGD